MKTCSGCRVQKALDQFGPRPQRGPSARRSRCKDCGNAARKMSRAAETPDDKARALALAIQWKRDNRERNLAKKRAWEAANPDRVRVYSLRSQRKYYWKNPALSIQRTLACRAKNLEAHKAYNARYVKENAATCRARYKAYMARKQRAMPAWADDFLIQQFYDCCTERNKLLTGGVKWHVDHMVPLNSPRVCGLHVQDNLAVIPQRVNLSKANRFWPDA